MVKILRNKTDKINQGDIISDVEFIENVTEENGVLKITKIVFPLVIVLSQECDLTWDYDSRNSKKEDANQDKYLFSIIVAPLYNYLHFINGEHLSELEQKMQTISSKPSKTDNKLLRQNENPRYHYLEFDDSVDIVNSVIDFKHYFTVNTLTLQKHKENHFVCSLDVLFRERVTQRFSNYLSRIGLPTT